MTLLESRAWTAKKSVAPGAMKTQLTSTQLEFRQAMAHLASAVSIVTTDGPAGRLGITVGTVCSVTDSPPTVLICVNQRSAARNVFAQNKEVAINILASGQSELATHFSGATNVPMDERFEWDIWDDSARLPVLREARVALVGRVSEHIERGTHSVMFVELTAIQSRENSDGLVYYGRAFHHVGNTTAL